MEALLVNLLGTSPVLIGLLIVHSRLDRRLVKVETILEQMKGNSHGKT